MWKVHELSDPEFGPIKARLARVYLEHKGDLEVLLTDDAEIIAHVDEITALLLAASSRALRADNQRWRERYRWFFEAIAELQDDAAGQAARRLSAAAAATRRVRGSLHGGLPFPACLTTSTGEL